VEEKKGVAAEFRGAKSEKSAERTGRKGDRGGRGQRARKSGLGEDKWREGPERRITRNDNVYVNNCQVLFVRD
jgi:hypothetical protein